MTCILELVGRICPEIEAQLRPRLRGLGGFLVAGYLPQVWVLITDEETVTLHVDGQGNAEALAGRPSNPDVTITTTHAVLSAALRTRNRANVPQAPMQVQAHTAKGRTAFQFLRTRFGL